MAGLVYPLVVEDRASAPMGRFAEAAERASGGVNVLGRSINDLRATEMRSVQTAVKHAESIATVNKAMTDSVGTSDAVRRATLGVLAAQDQVNAVMTSGRASVAKYAAAQSGLIGQQERLAAAEREVATAITTTTAAQGEAAVASEGLMGSFGGLIKTAGELGVVVGGIEIAKKAVEFIGAGKDLTSSLNAVQAATNATATQMQAVRTQSIGLGKDLTVPGATAVDAADAIQDLVKAGIALPRAMQAARPSLLLASAAQTDMADTSKVLGDTLDIYSLSGTKAAHVANVYAAATYHTSGSLMDLFNAQKYVGPSAQALGISFDSVSAALVELGKNGIQSSMAGTGLRTALTRLASTSPAVTSALKDMGVQAFNSQGSFVGFPKLFNQLHAAQQRFGPDSKQFIGDLNSAFGQRAQGVMALFADKGGGDYKKFLNIIESGNVQKIADIQNRGVGASFTQLGKQATAAGISIYTGLEPKIESILELVSLAIPQAIDIASNALAPFVSGFKLAGEALSPLVHALEPLARYLKPLAPELKFIASAALAYYGATKLVALGSAAWELVVRGINRASLATAGWSAETHSATASVLEDDSAASVSKKTYSVEAIAANDAIVASNAALAVSEGRLAASTQTAAATSAAAQSRFKVSSTGALNGAFAAAAEAKVGYDSASTKTNNQWLKLLGAAGGPSTWIGNKIGSELTKNSGQVVAGFGSVAGAAKKTATTARANGAAMADDAAKVKAAAAQAKALDASLQNLAQGQLAAAQSQDSFREGILSLTKTLRGNHDQLNTNTQAGLANRDALLGMLGQAVSLAQAQKANGRSIDGVTGSLQANVRQLVQTAKNAGVSKSAVHSLVAQMGLTPKDIATKFQTNAPAVLTQLNAVKTKMIDIARGANATINVHTVYSNGGTNTVKAQAAGTRAVYGSGTIPPNTRFTVGERGWEGGVTDAQGRATIYSQVASKALGFEKPAGYASGSSNEQTIATYLSKVLGFAKKGVAAVLGNWRTESSFNPAAYNPNENAHGLSQDEGDRWTAMQHLANKLGLSTSSMKLNLLNFKREISQYPSLLKALRSGTESSRALAAKFDIEFERSTAATRSARESNAASIYRDIKSGKLTTGGGPPVSKVGAGVRDYPHGYPGRRDDPNAAGSGVDGFVPSVPKLSKFIVAARSAVAKAVAKAVAPAATSPAALAQQLTGSTARAVSAGAVAGQARNVFGQYAHNANLLKKQLTDLRIEQRKGVDGLRAHATALGNDATKAAQRASAMPSATKAEKAAKDAAEKHAQALRNEATAAGQAATKQARANSQDIAGLEKREQAAEKAASRSKDAWGKAKAAADKARQAATAAATALVSSLQAQADALTSAVQSFESGIAQGIAQGSDLATIWGAATDAAQTYKDTVTSLSVSILGDVSLGTLWTNATDAQTTAASGLADAQQAVADAQQAINDATPDTSSLTAASNAQEQAQAQFTSAHAQLLSAQSAVAAGSGSPAQYAALTQAQQQQTNTLSALSAANADLATAQQAVASATGPTTDQTQALTTAQTQLAAAEAAAAKAGTSTADALNDVLAAFKQQLSDAADFSSDLATLVNDGLSVGMAQQIAAMGASAGDQLAKAILAGGPAIIGQLNTLGTQAGKSFAGAVAAAGSSPASLQDQFNTVLASAQGFASDLTALAKDGAGQDLISQIAGMGPASGDALAQQLLAGGTKGVAAFQSTMTTIGNLAGSTATQLAQGFFSAGATALENLIKGMEKQYPAMKAALAPILAALQAMFTFTPTVVTPGGSATVSGGGVVSTPGTGSVSSKTITLANAWTVGALAAKYNETITAFNHANPSFLGSGADAKVAAGTKVKVPSFARGVGSYKGAAWVGENGPEMVTFPRSVAVHSTGTPVVDMKPTNDLLARMEQRLASLEQHAGSAPALTGAAVGDATVNGYKKAGTAAARQTWRAVHGHRPAFGS